MKNRLGVTVRLNLEDQANMRSLCEFWSAEPKKVLKIAFEQLVISTDQLQTRLQKQEKENETDQTDTGVVAGSGDSPSVDNPASSGADTAGEGSDPAPVAAAG